MNLDQIFNASQDFQVVVSLDHTIKQINSSYLRYLGLTREAAVGSKCRGLLKGALCEGRDCPLKRVIEDQEIIEIEVFKRGYDGVATPFLLTATPLKSFDNSIVGMIASFKNISKLKESETQLQKVFRGTIRSMAEVVETRDPYTAGHQQRVAKIAEKIALRMGLSQPILEAIHTSATLHDIGKIYVPSEFLTKPGKLSHIEFEIIKTHSQKGYDILKSIPFNYPVAKIVLQHHERMDGSGYPCGLDGDSILLEARIIGVADVVEAIFSDRPYRKGLGMEAAFEELEKNKGIKYDANVVDVLMKIQKEMP
jgi:PAS domain S-box-containing protein/putative nucleotidyltransferase with HDIG domain